MSEVMRKKPRKPSYFFILKKRTGISRHAIHGFTAAELLTVTTIICILAALLFPSLKTAREMANRAVCVSNIKEQYYIFYVYAQEHDHAWVPTRQMSDPGGDAPSTGADNRSFRLLCNLGYIDSTRQYRDLYYCPSNRTTKAQRDDWWRGSDGCDVGKDTGYHYFGWWDSTIDGYSSPKRVADANATILIQDIAPYADVDVWFPYDGSSNHPMPGLNVGFVDGHIEWLMRDMKALDMSIPMWKPSYE